MVAAGSVAQLRTLSRLPWKRGPTKWRGAPPVTRASRYPRGKRVCQAERRVRREARSPCHSPTVRARTRWSLCSRVDLRRSRTCSDVGSPRCATRPVASARRSRPSALPRPPPIHDRFLRRLSEGDEWKAERRQSHLRLVGRDAVLASEVEASLKWGRRTAMRALPGRRRRPARRPPAARGHSRPRPRRDRGYSRRCARRRQPGAAELADGRPANPEGMDRTRRRRRPTRRGQLAVAPGSAGGYSRAARPSGNARRVVTQLPTDELFDADGRPRTDIVDWIPAGDRRLGATRTPTAAATRATWTCRTFRRTPCPSHPPARRHPEPTRVLGGWLRDVMSASAVEAATSASSARTRRSPTGSSGVRRHRQGLAGRDSPSRRAPGSERQSPGDPVRAHLPGMAGGVPAHGPAWPVLLLRGVRAHRRLDVQPARQVAEGHPRPALATAHPVAELPVDFARVAAGPQRLLAPGPRIHRPCRQQEGRGHPRLPAAGRQHPAVGRRSLPAQPQLRQRHRRRKAVAAGLVVHG